MSCCEGSCSCGKGDQAPEEEKPRLVQLAASQETLSTIDWMKGLWKLAVEEELVEIRFKSNRKAFYKNRFGLKLAKDDRIVVETEGGYDLGTVSLSGSMAGKEFEQKPEAGDPSRLKKVYRKASQEDLENWLSAKKRERDVLLEARKIVYELGLEISIGDVEFQGDGRKVIVYYTAEKGMDSQELVRRYASSFGVKVDMRQNWQDNEGVFN